MIKTIEPLRVIYSLSSQQVGGGDSPMAVLNLGRFHYHSNFYWNLSFLDIAKKYSFIVLHSFALYIPNNSHFIYENDIHEEFVFARLNTIFNINRKF